MRKEANRILDDVVNEIRDEKIDSSIVNEAAGRVLARVSAGSPLAAAPAREAEHLRDCNDFQSLIPSYLNGRLSAARILLLEDHAGECFACRDAVKTARAEMAGSPVRKAISEKASWFSFKQPSFRFAVAALLVLGIGLGSWPLLEQILNSFKSFNAIVLASNGPVYRLSGSRSQLLQPGEKILRGDHIRTAKGAVATVKLGDGTKIEMAERAEFSLTEGNDGTTINLERGNVIVEAAKQSKGKHLFVRTDDALVSVVGTIFSVNNGTKGSRVSVVEGQVRVEHNGKESSLLPGDQTTTSASINRIPIQDEVSWSQNADRYRELLAEVAKVRREIAALPVPGVRNSTRILDMMPDGTVLYVALPNLAETLGASYDLVKQRIDQNPELQAWWNSQNKGETDKAFARIREFGSYLGEEITVSFELNDKGRPGEPLFVAELRNAEALRTAISQFDTSSIQFVDDPATAQAVSGKGLNVWLNGDLLAASPALPVLQRLAVALKAPGANRFNTSLFHERIADRYRDGTSILAAADLEKIAPQVGGTNANAATATEQLGLNNFRHLIAEIRNVGGKAQNSAELTFREANKGIASWLAQPAPLGSLDFISPEANLVGAFAIKDPAALADNLINALKTVQPKFSEELAKFEADHGVSLRNDIAAPLGGEFTFAIDGPLLPTPSWKLLVEVYDQARMQDTLARVVAEVNRIAAEKGKKGLELTSSESGGQQFFTVKSLDAEAGFSYAFVKGYLIIAPSISLIDRAIRYAESGSTIKSSPKFIASLPEDKQANFSAVLYQNLGTVLTPLARNLGNIAGGAAGDKAQTLAAFVDGAPTLAYAYSFGDRITVSVNTEKGALNIGDFLALPGSMAMQGIISGAMKH